MKPSLSLLAVSISAAIALNPLGARSVQAALLVDSAPRSSADNKARMAIPDHSSDEPLNLIDSAEVVSALSRDSVVVADATLAAQDAAESSVHDQPEAIAETRTSDVTGDRTADSPLSPDTESAAIDRATADDAPTTDETSDPVQDRPAVAEADTLAQDVPESSNLSDSDPNTGNNEGTPSREAVNETLYERLFPNEQINRVDIQVDPDRLNGLTIEDSSAVLDAPSTAPPEAFGLDAEDTPVSVPEYLNSPANPLTFPTQPEEIELSGTQPITLEQAIELARQNSTTLQESLLQLEQSQAALREAQAAYLPTLDADLSITHQGTNTFAEFAEPIDPTNPFGGSITVTDSIYNEATTLNGRLTVSYDIFTSGRRSALVAAAEERVRLQELQVEVVSEQLRLDVTQDYYDLQQTDELVRIAAQSLEESLQSLRDAQALERAGVGTRFDVLQAEVEAANSRQDLIQALSDQEVARRQLSQRINSAESIDLSAADPVDIAGYWDISLEDSIALAYQNRAELEQQLAQRDISEQQRRAQLSALGPQLAAFAQYNFSDLLDETESPGNDLETYAIGLQANIRLYDGGAARAAARQEELNMALAENAFEDTKRLIRFQVEQSYSTMRSNLENIQTALLAVETATEALRLARLRFQAGVGTQTDVLQAQTDLTRAEVNRLQAVLGYNRALAQLQRSVSNLPDSDLSDRP
ncbi:MAG: TolC family protein [Synechococcales cyanobacterium T60_A2020_003]|nr:TolC family protein [Synechococcales cyanobacterium T60_A2020_003]